MKRFLATLLSIAVTVSMGTLCFAQTDDNSALKDASETMSADSEPRESQVNLSNAGGGASVLSGTSGSSEGTIFFDDYEDADIITGTDGKSTLRGYKNSVLGLKLVDAGDEHGKVLSFTNKETGYQGLQTNLESNINGGKFGVEFDYILYKSSFSLDILPVNNTWGHQFRAFFMNSGDSVPCYSSTPNTWPAGNKVMEAKNTKAWQHISIIVDCDAKTITYERTCNGAVDKVTKSINYDSDQYWKGGNITSFSFGNLGALSDESIAWVDNFRVWIPQVEASSCKIEDYNGSLNELKDVPATSVAAQVTFSGEIDPTSVTEGALKLVNETTGEETPLKNITLLDDKKTLRAEFPDTLLSPNSDYAIRVEKSITGKNGYSIASEALYKFNTKEGGFKISGFKAEKNGQSVKVSASSILTDGSSHKVILALTTEKDNKLISIKKKTIELSANGRTDMEIEDTLPAGVEFDKVFGYIWDLGTLIPIENCVSAE